MEEDTVLYLRWLCIYKVQFLQAPNIFLDSMDYFCFLTTKDFEKLVNKYLLKGVEICALQFTTTRNSFLFNLVSEPPTAQWFIFPQLRKQKNSPTNKNKHKIQR